jgi:hypothetical protein
MMATAETTQDPVLDRKVYDALRKEGVKYSELSPEQSERARSAGKEHAGLAGKALVAWIVDGKDLKEQTKEAEGAREVKAAAAKAEKAERAPSRRSSAYPQDVRDAVKRANEIRGKSHGAGPKQHATVREVVRKSLGVPPSKSPTVDQLVAASGAGSLAKLTKLANGTAGREDLKALQPLAKLMGDDAWCKGRHLAAALVAWAEQIKASAKK